MKNISKILSILTLVLLITSCKNDKSLQSYLVETSTKEGFMTGDLPVSSILNAKADVSNDVKETIKSIKKINVVYLPKTAENEAQYLSEKTTLQNIFKDNKEYKNLMSMKAKEMNVKIYYSGDTDSIDEVIAFGFSDQKGVGVARLLGENMNPAKIIETIKGMDFNENSPSLKQFYKMFKKN